MTDHEVRPVSARTREEDKGFRGRVRAWWSKWGELTRGLSGIIACVGCCVLAFFLWQAGERRADDQRIVRVLAQAQSRITLENAKRAKETAATAKLSCQRSRKLGPQLADYYALDPKFPREVLVEYKATIPKTCPK